MAGWRKPPARPRHPVNEQRQSHAPALADSQSFDILLLDIEALEDAMNDMPMHGRVALVAGASKGIGAATAEAFAAAGASVVLAARDLAAPEAVAKRITGHGGQAIAVRADVSDADSMQQLVDQAIAAYG